MIDNRFPAARRVAPEYRINFKEHPHLVSGAEACDLGLEFVHVFEYLTLAEAEEAIGKNVKSLRRKVLIQSRGHRMLIPRKDGWTYARNDDCGLPCSSEILASPHIIRHYEFRWGWCLGQGRL
jgi:hypothetical protein